MGAPLDNLINEIMVTVNLDEDDDRESLALDPDYVVGLGADAIRQLRDEKAGLKIALKIAIARLEDMCIGDDGQAWKEAEKALPKLKSSVES